MVFVRFNVFVCVKQTMHQSLATHHQQRTSVCNFANYFKNMQDKLSQSWLLQSLITTNMDGGATPPVATTRTSTAPLNVQPSCEDLPLRQLRNLHEAGASVHARFLGNWFDAQITKVLILDQIKYQVTPLYWRSNSRAL